MKLLWRYVATYKKTLLGALILAAINQGFSLLDPQIFRLIIDDYASKVALLSQREFLTGILLLLLASVLIALISRTAKNFQDYFVNVVTQRVGAQLYANAVAHSFSLPYAVFEDQRSGELLQKLQKARTDSQQLIRSLINIVFLSLIGIAFILTYAFIVHWMIGVVYFFTVPIIGLTTFALSQKLKRVQQKITSQSAELAGSTTETIRNVELVKSLGLEPLEIKRLNRVNDQILALELTNVRIVRTMSFLQGTLVNTMRSVLLLLMLWLIFRQNITLGQFFSLLFYSFFLFNPLQEFGTIASQYQETKASMGQLEEILRLPKQEKPKQAIDVGPITAITFQNVTFTYPSAKLPSVKNITLSISSGQTIAFVGPSGAGKTTLVKLILGLYQPLTGRLFFNDINSKRLNYDTLRQRIGLVSQETQLFAGTIRENLLFVRPEASDKDCLEALRLASSLSILKRGGQGLDTKIGEGGIKLSGGERQRLAIARALLRRPEIIIFDEATSNLDSLTEREITKTIQKIEQKKPNLITILVAHRLSTISHADMIYVLEQGEIGESGTHNNLLQERGLYAALWREQGGRLSLSN